MKLYIQMNGKHTCVKILAMNTIIQIFLLHLEYKNGLYKPLLLQFVWARSVRPFVLMKTFIYNAIHIVEWFHIFSEI